MFKISVSDKIKAVCPLFEGIAVYAEVKNGESSTELWSRIDTLVSQYKTLNTLDSIKQNPAIAATRSVYKMLGKDPNRYRPSSEALCRRIMRDIPLYRIDNLVDIINLVSIQTGYSIGGFDASKIAGDTLVLGVGEENEPYESIGRGMLNIEGLPVYRDELGGIGTPTSDNNRTKIDLQTVRILAVINGYSGKDGLTEAADLLLALLHEFADAKEEKILYF